MDLIAKVAPLIIQGIGAASALLSMGQSAAPAWAAIKRLTGHAEAGTLTQEVIDDTQSTLDSLIDRFNRPI